MVIKCLKSLFSKERGLKSVDLQRLGSLQISSGQIGIAHQGRSKAIEEIREIPFDIVITVCDSASEECPIWLGAGKHVHVSFPDPVSVSGSEAEIITALRNVRDDILREIPRVLEQFSNQ